jgi:phosphatidylinositol alpha-mannosyltransferase
MATTNATKSLKIGLVLDTSLDQPDGVQQYVATIGEWLRAQGHDVHYLVGQTKRTDLPNIHSLSRNISVQSNGNRTTIPLPTSRRKLRRFLQTNPFDVLHVQTPHHPLMAQHLIMATGPRTAVIGTFHIVPYSRLEAFGTRLLSLWLRPSLKRFDEMVSVSQAAADFCQRAFGLQSQVLPNVFDYERFHQALPLPAYDDDRLTILFLGRLVPRKGCQLLLEAVAQLARDEHSPQFRVVICGSGHLEAKLRRFIAQHNLEDIVTLVGFVSEADKPRYYASADIAVFPSQGGESFGIVLLEAMASGRAAVLAGDNVGYRSVLAPRPELLFDPRNTTELANKLREYMVDAKLRSQARTWETGYAKNFDVTVVGQELLKIYDKALRKRRQP